MKRRAGFTLIEMMVVIVIIMILAGVTIALMNTFFRGQGVRQGGMMCTQAFAMAKGLAAETRQVHFLVFQNKTPAGGYLNVGVTNDSVGGVIRIFRDANPGPNAPVYDNNDILLEGRDIELPKYCDFATGPAWVGFNPSGYCIFPSGFTEISSGKFESDYQANTPSGDLVIQMQGKPYKIFMDIDKVSGKIRKQHFFAQ